MFKDPIPSHHPLVAKGRDVTPPKIWSKTWMLREGKLEIIFLSISMAVSTSPRCNRWEKKITWTLHHWIEAFYVWFFNVRWRWINPSPQFTTITTPLNASPEALCHIVANDTVQLVYRDVPWRIAPKTSRTSDRNEACQESSPPYTLLVALTHQPTSFVSLNIFPNCVTCWGLCPDSSNPLSPVADPRWSQPCRCPSCMVLVPGAPRVVTLLALINLRIQVGVNKFWPCSQVGPCSRALAWGSSPQKGSHPQKRSPDGDSSTVKL